MNVNYFIGHVYCNHYDGSHYECWVNTTPGLSYRINGLSFWGMVYGFGPGYISRMTLASVKLMLSVFIISCILISTFGKLTNGFVEAFHLLSWVFDNSSSKGRFHQIANILRHKRAHVRTICNISFSSIVCYSHYTAYINIIVHIMPDLWSPLPTMFYFNPRVDR